MVIPTFATRNHSAKPADFVHRSYLNIVNMAPVFASILPLVVMPKKTAFQTRLERILSGIVNSAKQTGIEARLESAFSARFWCYITNCDKSRGWEQILGAMEQATPIEVRDILGSPGWMGHLGDPVAAQLASNNQHG